MKAPKAKPAGPEFVELPVYTMEQLNNRPGVPVPEGFMLADIPTDAIWGTREDGRAFIDHEAMEVRDALLKAGGIFVPLNPAAINKLATLMAKWQVAPARFLQAHVEADINDSADDEDVEHWAVREGQKLEGGEA